MMANQKYYNFKETLQSKGKLLTLSQIQSYKGNPDKDYYVSLYHYNDDQKKLIESKGSYAGIDDVKADALVWDFDDKANPENARADALELGQRLVRDYKVLEDSIQYFFSGQKGLHVVLPIDREVTPQQFKKVTSELAKGLKTFDVVVSDPARVIRLEYTKHPKTGLYKIPMFLNDLKNYDMKEIAEFAVDLENGDVNFNTIPVKLPESLYKVVEKKKEINATANPADFDYKTPPKGWKQYKWALAQGWFESGERHQALMVVAATCRGLGYDKQATYYLCKSALKKQAARTGEAEFDKTELFENIIESSVFSDRWEGGQYSPDTNPWLAKYCEKMGFDKEEKDDGPSVKLDDLIAQFIDYSTNFDQNIIKTGIAELDENLILSTSTLNGLLGQPGSGKTTVAIEILRNASLNNIPAMFFSLDMGPPLVFSKLVQKETGIDFRSVMQMYKNEFKKRDEVSQLIKKNYANIAFNFKCGSTVLDLKRYINEQKEQTGLKPKLVIVDYMELVSGPYSDPTANAAVVAHGLKNLATEEEVCILLLLQTQKHSTPDISDPLLSMKQIKGASAIEQDCSVVLTLWREGYSPNTVKDDKYISFALVKNRFGSLWRGDFSWNPVKGNIRSLAEEEYADFEEFLKRKKEARANDQKEKDDWK